MSQINEVLKEKSELDLKRWEVQALEKIAEKLGEIADRLQEISNNTNQ